MAKKCYVIINYEANMMTWNNNKQKTPQQQQIQKRQ